MKPLLEIRNLTKFYSKNDKLPAVCDISLVINKNSSLALIGESGCGKTTLAKIIMGLEKPTKGDVVFNGSNIAKMKESQLRPLRRDVQMIFQYSKSVFNPSYTVGDSIREVLLAHEKLSHEECQRRLDEIFEVVKLPNSFQKKYVSQLSGGQCQRANIARSLILKPKLLICDEPVASLDYAIRHRVLELLQEIRQTTDVTYLLITHDLSNVKDLCQNVAIMYKGNIVELAKVETDLDRVVKHPYSIDLFKSIPCADPRKRSFINEPTREYEYTGETLEGCVYKNRCTKSEAICDHNKPLLRETEHKHFIACNKFNS